MHTEILCCIGYTVHVFYERNAHNCNKRVLLFNGAEWTSFKNAYNGNGCLFMGTETFTEHVGILFSTGYTVFYLHNAYPQFQKRVLQKRFAQKNNFMTVASRCKIMQGITVFLAWTVKYRNGKIFMSDIMVRFHSWILLLFLFIYWYIPLWKESLNSEGQQYSNNINNTTQPPLS